MRPAGRVDDVALSLPVPDSLAWDGPHVIQIQIAIWLEDSETRVSKPTV
jgi:hypothetical protein